MQEPWSLGSERLSWCIGAFESVLSEAGEAIKDVYQDWTDLANDLIVASITSTRPLVLCGDLSSNGCVVREGDSHPAVEYEEG